MTYSKEKLAEMDQRALFTGKKVILSLAEKGGFAESSRCGMEGGTYYWNNPSTFCFLEVDKEVNIAFNKIFLEQYKGDQRYAVSHQGSELVGLAEKEIIISNQGTQYSLYPHFRINLGYNFDEYFQLQKEAAGIAQECKAAQKLQECLKKIMPKHWKFGGCEQEAYNEKERKVAFCAESAQKYVVFDDGAFIPVRYKFGLNFAST